MNVINTFCGHFVFVFVICVWRAEGQIEEGSSCTKDGVSGVCRKIDDCASAIAELKMKRMPQTCGFIGTVPVVCCLDGRAPTTSKPTTIKTQPPPIATTTLRPSTSTTEYVPAVNDYIEIEGEQTCRPISPERTKPKTGRKAWDKCIEYQDKYVYPCGNNALYAGINERQNNCKHSAGELVVNGEAASEAEFPHMALLGFGEGQINFLCGGSVISENFILTAGHCTSLGRGEFLTYALVGILRRSDKYDKSNLYRVKNITKHPGYNSPYRYNDIALVETDRGMRLYLLVIPACLDLGTQVENVAVATGWGALSYRGQNADVLQKVELTNFTEETCSSLILVNRNMPQGYDARTQLCYGDVNAPKDTCSGDSGGPIQIKNSDIHCMYTIVGVTSAGLRCGLPGQPAIYTKVSYYVPWIESIVWP